MASLIFPLYLINLLLNWWYYGDIVYYCLYLCNSINQLDRRGISLLTSVESFFWNRYWNRFGMSLTFVELDGTSGLMNSDCTPQNTSFCFGRVSDSFFCTVGLTYGYFCSREFSSSPLVIVSSLVTATMFRSHGSSMIIWTLEFTLGFRFDGGLGGEWSFLATLRSAGDIVQHYGPVAYNMSMFLQALNNI